MSKNQHLFIIDSVSNLNLKMDTSLAIAKELILAGHNVYLAYPEGLSYQSHLKDLQIYCQRLLSFNENDGKQALSLESAVVLPSTSFNTIHMRKDPPFDNQYLTLTYLLDIAVQKNVRVYNSPSSLRNLNEKLAILQFPRWTTSTIVSSDPEQIWNFMLTGGGKSYILKPLFFHGGRGVTRLEHELAKKDQSLKDLKNLCGDGAVIVQPFLNEIFQGELRCFGVCGKVISWCRKTPAKGEFIASSYRGAAFTKTEPTLNQRELAEDVLPKLHKMGASIVGLDIIGDYLSEVNITSPRLLRGVDDQTNYAKIAVEILLEELF